MEEFQTARTKLLCLCILLLFFGPLIVSLNGVSLHELELEKEMRTSEVEALELVPYSDFSGAPNITNLGLSNQFSWTHHKSQDGNDFNYVNFTWNHVANTELDFLEEYSSTYEYPDCHEYIYLSQSFNWSFESRPIDQSLRVEFGIETTGNFSRTGEGALMFRVYVWFIDSSNNWIRVHYSSRPYETGLTLIPIPLNAQERRELWDGMVEDEYGMQEDPEDKVTIAIGLSPTRDFLEYGDFEPWREYSGSVTLQVKRMSFEVLVPTMISRYEILPIVHNNTLLDLNDTNPMDLALAEDGSAYTVGYATYILDEQYRSNMIFTKWDSQANIIWSKILNGIWSAAGDGVVAYGDYVYTLCHVCFDSEYDWEYIIIKWDSFGNQIWNSTWNIYSGQKIDVDNNGSIYVFGGELHERTHWYVNQTGHNVTVQLEEYFPALSKFSSDGTLEWTREWGIYGSPIPPFLWHLEISPDGSIFTKDDFNCTKWDKDGNMIWSSFYLPSYFIATSEGKFYSLKDYRDIIEIGMFNISEYEGHKFSFYEWYDTINITYGQWRPELQIGSISLGFEDSAYSMIFESRSRFYQDYRYDGDIIILKYNSIGTQLWNRSLEIDDSEHVLLMESSLDGIIYCAGNDNQGRIILRIYHDPDKNIPLIPENVALALYITAAILIVIVVADYIRRKKRVSL